MPRKVTFAVDLDGVCCNYYGALKTILSTERKCVLPDAEDYKMTAWFPKRNQHRDAHHRAVAAGMWKTMPAIPGAAEGIQKIQAAGIRVIVATARGNFGEAPEIARTHTQSWLQSNGILVDDLFFASPKYGVDADLFVDDNPYEIDELRRHGKPAIVFDHNYNRELAGPRAYGWDDLVPMVLAYFEPVRSEQRSA
jgi:5'(3')-deoxyribonucleotidase